MSNIIFFTTDCNMRCEYCFEENNRQELKKAKTINIPELKKYLDDIAIKEKNPAIVLFGGEPLLRFNEVKFTIDYCTLEYPTRFNFCLVTNGLRLYNPEIYDYVRDAIVYKNVKLEVSYDGSGHFRRKLCNGKSSEPLVKKIIGKLNSDCIPFWISYTLHSGNFEHYIKDLVNLFEKYTYLQGIVTSPNHKEFDVYFTSKKKIKEYKRDIAISAQYIFMLYGKPICDLTCGVCKKCNKSADIYNNYITEDSVVVTEKKDNAGEFNKWI